MESGTGAAASAAAAASAVPMAAAGTAVLAAGVRGTVPIGAVALAVTLNFDLLVQAYGAAAPIVVIEAVILNADTDWVVTLN